MRLGGPVFVKTDDPRELARAHRELGYRAAYCPGVDINDTARIAAITKAFAAEDVVIAEVGAWCNIMSPDLAERKKNIDHVIHQLALADAVGALCCVDIAGSFHPTNWAGPHPDNLSTRAFEITVENARTIIDAVKPKRAKFSIEMMQWVVPDSAESYASLLMAVDRPAFAVHMDPVNLINSPARYYDTAAVIRECFERLGDKIVSCHAKDIILRENATVHLDEILPGRGGLDYKTFLTCLNALPQDAPLMLEHLATAADYAQARDYIVGVARKCGLTFER
jgi:sugar phosphate isomerase/epimerase